MNAKEVKNWLKNIDDEEQVVVYIKTNNDKLVNPNMGCALRDEIFEWQDKLDDIEYSDEGLVDLYLLTEDILSQLESRLKVDPELIKSLEKAGEEKPEPFELPEYTFFDLVNKYVDATKIGDVLQSCTLLIYYVKNKIKGVECDIHDGKLWITRIDNASCSTSIISELLNIKANNIDDSQWEDGIWSIHLHKR